jgi:hypothetical protein
MESGQIELITSVKTVVILLFSKKTTFVNEVKTGNKIVKTFHEKIYSKAKFTFKFLPAYLNKTQGRQS